MYQYILCFLVCMHQYSICFRVCIYQFKYVFLYVCQTIAEYLHCLLWPQCFQNYSMFILPCISNIFVLYYLSRMLHICCMLNRFNDYLNIKVYLKMTAKGYSLVFELVYHRNKAYMSVFLVMAFTDNSWMVVAYQTYTVVFLTIRTVNLRYC